jgi:hypothetical protein
MAQCNGLLYVRVMLFLLLLHLIACGAYGHVSDVGTKASVAVFSKNGLEIPEVFVTRQILSTFADSVLRTFDAAPAVVACRCG